MGLWKSYPSIDRCLQALRAAREDAEAALQMSKQRIRDEIGGQGQGFEVGQTVWLSIGGKVKIK